MYLNLRLKERFFGKSAAIAEEVLRTVFQQGVSDSLLEVSQVQAGLKFLETCAWVGTGGRT